MPRALRCKHNSYKAGFCIALDLGCSGFGAIQLTECEATGVVNWMFQLDRAFRRNSERSYLYAVDAY